MNHNIVRGKWKRMRGLVKEWWGELIDDELERFEGRVDRLAGRVQERYGLWHNHDENAGPRTLAR
jgi:uncharacterized protein YjbJ (UPF0337 family)